MLNTLEHGISKNILLMQIEAGLFERQIALEKISNFKATLPMPQSDFAHYLLKDPYIFDFVHAKEQADERNIEEQLTQHITQFLLELGQGFAFVGRQYALRVGGKDYYTDLLFYHTKLHCYVVVELKARAFEPGDPAQLNFYINVINDVLKTEQDNDTIGILLCKGKNEIVAEYALRGYNQPIGVADYVLSKAVPERLQSTLPQIEDLEQELKELDRDK
jgi:predicted nuclease of restriction endonuclease-like (RecB) superfamily